MKYYIKINEITFWYIEVAFYKNIQYWCSNLIVQPLRTWPVVVCVYTYPYFIMSLAEIQTIGKLYIYIYNLI